MGASENWGTGRVVMLEYWTTVPRCHSRFSHSPILPLSHSYLTATSKSFAAR